jgi:predicted RNA-binding protein with RPS1 domain
VKADPAPTPGDLVRGFVVTVGPKGLFVRLSAQLTGRALIKDLADGFIEDPRALFKQGQLVEARVRSVAEGQVQLSLRPSEVQGKARIAEELANLQEGDVCQGTVQRLADFGVFVQISGTSIVGLARKEQAVGEGRALSEAFSVGDLVRAKVLRVSRESGKVALALHESFFRSQTAPVVPMDVEEVSEDESTAHSNNKQTHSAPLAQVSCMLVMFLFRLLPFCIQSVAMDEEDDLGPLQWEDANPAQKVVVNYFVY